MTCTSCGDKPEVDKNFTGPIVEINNPEKLVLLRKVVIPASLGDEEGVPAEIGKYSNVVLHYEANQHTYLYSSDGIPTLITAEVPQEVLDRIADLEDNLTEEGTTREEADVRLGNRIEAEEITRAQADASIEQEIVEEAAVRASADTTLQTNIDAVANNLSAETTAREGVDEDLKSQLDSVADDLETETTARTSADTNLQSQIDVITASSDVKDVVGTKAQLDTYDTPTLGDNDIIKVLQDESQSDETTYYRWSTGSSSFVLIGEEGPYYTRATLDTMLEGKQDALTPGEDIKIADQVVSATNRGLARELTEEDYNYDSDGDGVNDSIAVWRLKSNIFYLWGEIPQAKRVFSINSPVSQFNERVRSSFPLGVFIKRFDARNFVACFGEFAGYDALLSTGGLALGYSVSDNGVATYTKEAQPLIGHSIRNALDTTSTGFVLDARQGKTLDDKIGGDLANLNTTDKTSLINAINELAGQSGSGVIELTEDDYNHPETDPTSVALWLLEPGTYSRSSSVVVRYGDGNNQLLGENERTVFVTSPVDTGSKNYIIMDSVGTTVAIAHSNSSGGEAEKQFVLTRTNIIQTTGASTTSVMSQKAVTDAIATAIGDVTGATFEVVQTLPETGDTGTIYLLPNQGTAPNIYDEYIWVSNAWEKIGTTEIDLSNYVTATVLDTALAGYTPTAYLATVATSGDYNSLSNKPTVPTITMTDADPGEGSALATNNYVAVYDEDPIIMDYSTSEVNTGAKWIDGSTIYKKTVDCGMLPNSTSSTTAHGVSSIQNIVKIEGYALASQTGAFLPLPNTEVRLYATPTNIVLSTSTDMSTYQFSYVTIYYTKSS